MRAPPRLPAVCPVFQQSAPSAPSFSSLPRLSAVCPVFQQSAPSFSSPPRLSAVCPVFQQSAPSFSSLPRLSAVFQQSAPSFSSLSAVCPVFQQSAPSFSSPPRLSAVFQQSAPSFSSLPRLPRLSAVCPRFAWKAMLMFVCLNVNDPLLGGGNVGRFLYQLLFHSGNPCCDALAYLYSENSSSPWSPLVSAVLASLSARLFPLTPVSPWQWTFGVVAS